MEVDRDIEPGEDSTGRYNNSVYCTVPVGIMLVLGRQTEILNQVRIVLAGKITLSTVQYL